MSCIVVDPLNTGDIAACQWSSGNNAVYKAWFKLWLKSSLQS